MANAAVGVSLGRGAKVRPERPLDRVKVSPAWRVRPGSPQATTNLWPIHWSGPSWLFGILGDLHYAFPSRNFKLVSRGRLSWGRSCARNPIHKRKAKRQTRTQGFRAKDPPHRESSPDYLDPILKFLDPPYIGSHLFSLEELRGGILP